MNYQTISVGLGELAISADQSAVLVAYGLGSCVGVGMYDPQLHLAGLLHAVLPSGKDAGERRAKFVDSGINLLLERILEEGACMERLMVHLVGGANMLPSTRDALAAMRIGDRNVTAARDALTRLGLSPGSEIVGGTRGRTVRLYVHNGDLTLRELGNKEIDIRGRFESAF
ncbi:MAG: chemotaxis protein CheD [Anaerolineales bacterium]|nr:chemotaxis protein CheD [Anaerolineales bacterium]